MANAQRCERVCRSRPAPVMPDSDVNAFPGTAPQTAGQLEIHRSPDHAKWSNEAVTELSALCRSRLGQRSPDMESLYAGSALMGTSPQRKPALTPKRVHPNLRL